MGKDGTPGAPRVMNRFHGTADAPACRGVYTQNANSINEMKQRASADNIFSGGYRRFYRCLQLVCKVNVLRAKRIFKKVEMVIIEISAKILGGCQCVPTPMRICRYGTTIHIGDFRQISVVEIGVVPFEHNFYPAVA